MGISTQQRDKLLNRVRRIRGQLNAVEKALESEAECAEILHLLTASRGAMDSLLFEVLEDHIRLHVVDPEKRPTSQQANATRELIAVLKTYFK